MFRGKHAIGRAEERIGPRCKNGERLIAISDLEGDVRSFRLTNPVTLHLFEPLGPIQHIQVFQQPFRVSGNFEHPLVHEAAFNGIFGFNVFTVFHLFV